MDGPIGINETSTKPVGLAEAMGVCGPTVSMLKSRGARITDDAGSALAVGQAMDKAAVSTAIESLEAGVCINSPEKVGESVRSANLSANNEYASHNGTGRRL